MKMTLVRSPSLGGATIGRLYVDGVFQCYTLEDEIREIPGQPVATWKVKGATAIPAGEYQVILENSPRFGADTPTLLRVPGFEFIRMHAGNTAGDTEGCILLGMQVTAASIVGGTSRPAVAQLKALIQTALGRGEVVTIDINNPRILA